MTVATTAPAVHAANGQADKLEAPVAMRPAYPKHKYQLGRVFQVPLSSKIKQGFIKLFGCERGEHNRFLGGEGWVYLVVSMPSAERTTPLGCELFPVREEELDKWHAKPAEPASS